MIGTIYLPATTDRPAEPAPYVMAEAELVRMLRLDNEAPDRTLQRLRTRGLRATRIGKRLVYLLPNVLDFLSQLKPSRE